MQGLPLLTFWKNSTYGIMNGHVNACSWYHKQKINIKPQSKHVEDKQACKTETQICINIKKGLKRDKTCETSKTNNIRNQNQGFWASTCVRSQRPTYAKFKLRTHAHDMRAWDLFNDTNPETETENIAQTQKP